MIKFEDLKKEPAMFASMNGATQQGYYWFYKGGQIGGGSMSEQQIKQYIETHDSNNMGVK